MNNSLQFYIARAEEARTQGEAATLSRVRERFQRAEDAWQSLADGARRMASLREADAKRKEENGLRS